MTDSIEVRGLRVMAICGVLDDERRGPQPLVVDLDIELDVARAASSDDLVDTVNYAGLVDAAVAALTDARPLLLEAACEHVGRAVLGCDGRVDAVVVTVAKLHAPIPFDTASVGVRRRVTR